MDKEEILNKLKELRNINRRIAKENLNIRTDIYVFKGKIEIRQNAIEKIKVQLQNDKRYEIDNMKSEYLEKSNHRKQNLKKTQKSLRELIHENKELEQQLFILKSDYSHYKKIEKI